MMSKPITAVLILSLIQWSVISSLYAALGNSAERSEQIVMQRLSESESTNPEDRRSTGDSEAVDAPLSELQQGSGFFSEQYVQIRKSLASLSPRKILFWTGGILTCGTLITLAVVFGEKGNQGQGGSIEPYQCKDPVQLDGHRGMYLSLQAVEIGGNPLGENYKNILGDPAKENRVVSYIKKNNITSLALYDLDTILSSSSLTEELSNFIQRARCNGVKEVHAAGATANTWEPVLKYQSSHAGKFDGLVTELEFWSDGVDYRLADFLSLLKNLNSMRSLTQQYNQPQMLISSYIGVMNNIPDVSEIEVAQALAKYLNRVYLSCYATTPELAFQKGQDRFQTFINLPSKVDVIPILSAEGNAFNGGQGGQMGEWIQVNSLAEADAQFAAQMNQAFGIRGQNMTNHIFYFAYAFLDYYSGN